MQSSILSWIGVKISVCGHDIERLSAADLLSGDSQSKVVGEGERRRIAWKREGKMYTEQLRVMLSTSSYWLVGNYQLMGLRTQDALNDDRTDFVRLSDVHVFGQPDEECQSRLSAIILPKNKIEFVVLLASHHEAPEKRWNNFIPKHAAPVWLILGEYSIQGHMQLFETAITSVETLFRDFSDFFAIIGATVRRPGSARCEAPVLLANKQYVRAFHIDQTTDSTLNPLAELPLEDTTTGPFELMELLIESV